MIGLGVLIQNLGGNSESVDTYKEALGKIISEVVLGTEDALHLTFEDGSKITFADEGQSCCEERYMRTDDNLAEYIGAKFLGAEIKEAPNVVIPDDGGGQEHEVEFLEILTDKGCFTMASHNEHNGYYGGFCIRVSRG